MMKKVNLSLFTFLVVGILALSAPAKATVVLIKTNMGDIEVNLLDEHTPKTVSNFIQYIEAGTYQNTIIHRSVPNFVIQGGGFQYNLETDTVETASTFDPVVNEPVFSNVAGTIAMAKQAGDEDSATNQWFFNVVDNSSPLDKDNGGYTVFGVVTGNGLEIIDAINKLDRYQLGGAFDSAPLISLPPEDEIITNEHLVVVESITITDPNQDTQPELPPLLDNTDPAPMPTPPEDNDSSGGGSSSFLIIGALFIARLFRRS
ncbi:peptidylprolyl isomerase [Thalassotalea nanhaiensis]|uniref:Peptidyl-prolyl cis-trans isomerase n=1 Tax=Thalassotalea nanhaiensis TaxID=3065648 RepID=A0ABY9TIW8_9GAMM|nr:peptidylprolyl isomerase [Colwelliaceae bacterium SQ345]